MPSTKTRQLTLGEYLGELRAENGLSLAGARRAIEAQHHSAPDPSTISKIESGDRGLSFGLLVAMLRAYSPDGKIDWPAAGAAIEATDWDWMGTGR